MYFAEMINNSAIMGVVGVILGAIISGITIHVNNKQIIESQKRQSRIEKVEKTAINFLLLMQKLATHNLASQFEKDDIIIQKLKSDILNLNEQVKAEMHFYFEKEDYDLALGICAIVNPTSEEEAKNFNELGPEKIDCLLKSINKKIGK